MILSMDILYKEYPQVPSETHFHSHQVEAIETLVSDNLIRSVNGKSQQGLDSFFLNSCHP